MLWLQRPSLDSDKLDRHLFEHPVSWYLTAFMRKNNVWFVYRLWHINVQVFTLCWSVTDTSMNTWIMVIGQPHVEWGGSFKNQSTIISSHSIHGFMGDQYHSGPIMIFHETSLQFLERQTFYFILRGFPYNKPPVWDEVVRCCYDLPLLILSCQRICRALMEHFLKKPLQWPNLYTSQSSSWNWRNHLNKSSFQTNTMQLHGRTFPSTSDLKAAWDWLGSISWDVNVIFLTFAVPLPIWLVSWKRFSASTLIFWARRFVCCSWAT